MNLLRYTLVIFVYLLSNIMYAQQISVDTSMSEEELIQNVLIQGCVEVSNVSSQINGNVNGFNSFGYFESASSNFPFNNGIILSTGNVMSAGNTLNEATLNEGEDNWLNDSDLENALEITGTLNATSIEFDFISISNTIQFNYILASEEYYGNFPCEYSDGFAFLIKEANSSEPYTNIALVPGTSIPVNTNTIHEEIVGFCDAQNEQYFDDYDIGDTNFNGRTNVLTATATIVPNVQYHIKLVIADQTDENYDSAVFIEGSSFNATVDLGNDITTCADTVILDGNIENPQASYSWLLNGTPIDGETQPTLNVTQSGLYTVSIDIPINNDICTIEDSVVVNISSTQNSEPISDFEICDDSSADEIEFFDLTSKNIEVVNSVTAGEYSIFYYLSDSDAQNNINPISSPFQNTSNPQQIFVRIEDVNSGCLAFNSFNLVVNPLPNINTPTPLEICDNLSANGLTSIDLSQKNNEITNSNPNLSVSYHNSQTDAETGANPLSIPYNNTSQTEQLYVRVEDLQTGCVATTTLSISVLDNPVINTEDLYIDACDQDHDGYATFDLTTIIDDVLQGLSGVSTSFHESYEDAVTASYPIIDENAYDNITPEEQVVYIRVQDNITGCFSIAPIEIHTNLLLTATNITDFSLCDTDNDGEEEFSLGNIEDDIINNLPFDITIDFYESEEDRSNQVNALDTSQPYSPENNPQMLYLVLNSDTCSEVSEIELIITPIIEFDSIGTVDYCDTDQDGFTSIDLSTFDALVTEGQTGYTVTYFESEADANANTNALPNFYTNTQNPVTVYPRIRFNETGCASVNAFQINVLPAPISNQPTDIVVCDDDQDAISIVNLTSKISELVDDTTNINISFYTSISAAENGNNPIDTPEAYSTNTQTIFARIENTITGCYSTENFEIIVNTLPTFIPISNYKVCEQNSDGIGEFIFATKDTEILNGQTGKQVLYFETLSDAENRVNEIDKNSTYLNTSNPQTIYARVENLSDPNCFDTTSFTIEIGAYPQYNTPSDWSLCDDIANDGIETFDLNEKIIEISEGISDALNISFYTSLSNAENENNPIQDLYFNNTSNPQTIYAVIDNGSICNAITSFQLNVIQAPEANPAQPMTLCDDDYDGITTFDLTEAEFDILDVRQNHIVVEYFETLEDLDNYTNAIQNPSNYSNTSNPQTVFIRVTNTVSNCYLAIPLELNVNLPPTVNTIQNVNICENETQYFDLSSVNALLNDSDNINITYHTNQTDADNNTNPLNLDYTYQTNNDTIVARLENAQTSCYTTYAFQLIVNPNPVAHQPNDLESCDDDFDDILVFELSQQNSDILGNQNPNDFTVSYYSTFTDAELGTNALETNLTVNQNQTIFARVENNNTGCYAITEFNAIIHPRPIIDIDDQVICLENFPLLVSANTNEPQDTYLWSTGQTTPEIEITSVGTYWVTVTTAFGCETTRVFNVSESEAATIEVTETVDFSDPNNITVTISGIGNYLYQLDDNIPQTSNVFENVAIGYHTVTIIDLNGCSDTSIEVVVIDTPKFITPNGDGYFDTWHITGVEQLPGTVVNIYDRYGKHLASLTSTSTGWDGRYNGNLMPATDYWFVADVKKDGIEFQVKGHFALRL